MDRNLDIFGTDRVIPVDMADVPLDDGTMGNEYIDGDIKDYYDEYFDRTIVSNKHVSEMRLDDNDLHYGKVEHIVMQSDDIEIHVQPNSDTYSVAP
ncbi:ALA-interacting subunit 1-like [Dorcoceras hygrometricum]|uniref:ALA-interacting subunit 1-like n=1 Tax=Dorcoceras hygrometricum TaxID=472368 RepID=A0A2Z7CY28_9LAMI|nr:ALA-interacting subunit 1-like [Dorcoceras hygrometricum]